MTILEMIAEWRKGCTCAGPLAASMGLKTEGPEECGPCTVGLIHAIERSLLTPIPDCDNPPPPAPDRHGMMKKGL